MVVTRLFSFNTPNTPPPAKEDDLTFLRLIRSRRVGATTFHRLMAEHGGAAAALAELPQIARDSGVADYEPCPESVVAAELKAGRKAGARLIRCDSADYPALLRDLSDAPPAIWFKGNAGVLNRPLIAVIGARDSSSLGLRMARGLAGGLAEAGIGVVAGLARGIDTAAHEASLKSGTIAVMAGGIDVIYPSENRVLAATICDQGCLITEQPPGLEPIARHFPLRNRIISGLCRAVVVVEAATRSGSLITAKMALDQGREVMAVPGHPVDGRAGGCNQLIRDGALLIRSAEDILEALPDLFATAENPPPSPRQSAPVQQRRDTGGPVQLESRILSRLSPSPIEENALIRDLGLPAAVLAPAMLALELQGRLIRLAGGRVALG